jgi:hypothetical protein
MNKKELYKIANQNILEQLHKKKEISNLYYSTISNTDVNTQTIHYELAIDKIKSL